jgi:hypothetical protein
MTHFASGPLESRPPVQAGVSGGVILLKMHPGPLAHLAARSNSQKKCVTPGQFLPFLAARAREIHPAADARDVRR